jgi:hypothetical protein
LSLLMNVRPMPERNSDGRLLTIAFGKPAL